jgi:hypothetical protein
MFDRTLSTFLPTLCTTVFLTSRLLPVCSTSADSSSTSDSPTSCPPGFDTMTFLSNGAFHWRLSVWLSEGVHLDKSAHSRKGYEIVDHVSADKRREEGGGCGEEE